MEIKPAFLFPVMVLAAIGFVLSLAAHIMSLAGIPLPGGGLVWMLHIGIFVVWFPAIMVMKRVNSNSNTNPKDMVKNILAGCPRWMRIAANVLFAYAFVNFILFMINTSGHADPTGAAPPSVVRGFSGHWMFFYGMAFAAIYSALHAPQLLGERKCPQGHAAGPNARICPECGYAFPDK